MSFLRNVFGPSQAEVWRQLAEEISGDFIDGGFFGKKKVILKIQEWTILLDTHTVSSGKHSTTYTRIRAPYLNPDGFRFRISRSNFFYEIAKKFGAQAIKTGDQSFDQDFIVKSNNPLQVQRLLAFPQLRELIAQQPKFHFEVKDDEGFFGQSFPVGVDELRFQVIGVIKDIDRLKSLFTLFALSLNLLCQIGSAVDKDPGINLK